MSLVNLKDPEIQVVMLIKSIELRTECEDCVQMSFSVMLMEGCPYCALARRWALPLPVMTLGRCGAGDDPPPGIIRILRII